MPGDDDLRKLLSRWENRRLPGILGSLDFCKIIFKNCRNAWCGQFEGKEGVPAITLEAIAEDILWE